MSVEPHRLEYIDALRGYAILGVVLVHTEQWTPVQNEIAKLVCANGARGVQLFFLTSALALMLSLDARSALERRPMLNFFVRRFFRIAPMFYVGVTLYLALWGFAPRYWAPEGLRPWFVVVTALFLHGWHPETITSVVPGGWSIAVETTFYLLLPWLHRHVRKVATGLALFVASVMLEKAAAQWLAPLLCPPYPPDKIWIAGAFRGLWFFAQLPIFCLGVIAYFLHRPGNAPPNRPLGWSCLALALLLAVSWLRPTTLFEMLSPSVLFGGVSLLFAQALRETQSKILSNRLVVGLGRISFSLYLLHFAVLHFFREQWPTGLNLSQPWALPTALALVLCVSSAVAFLTYKLIEQPGIRAGQCLIDRIEQRTD